MLASILAHFFRLIVICLLLFFSIHVFSFSDIARANLGLCHSTFGTSVVHLTCCIAALVFGDTHTVIGSWAGFGPLFHFCRRVLLYEGSFWYDTHRESWAFNKRELGVVKNRRTFRRPSLSKGLLGSQERRGTKGTLRQCLGSVHTQRTIPGTSTHHTHHDASLHPPHLYDI